MIITLSDATFEHVRYAQRLADLTNLFSGKSLCLIIRNRGARDYLQVFNLSDTCQDVVLHAVREKIVRLFGAEILERQHGDPFFNRNLNCSMILATIVPA